MDNFNNISKIFCLDELMTQLAVSSIVRPRRVTLLINGIIFMEEIEFSKDIKPLRNKMGYPGWKKSNSMFFKNNYEEKNATKRRIQAERT